MGKVVSGRWKGVAGTAHAGAALEIEEDESTEVNWVQVIEGVRPF